MESLTTKDLTNEREISDVYNNMIIPMYMGSQKVDLPLHSFLLLGAPGIGKTEITKQFAEKLAELNKKPFVTNAELINNEDLLQDVMLSSDKYFLFIDLDLSKMEPSDFGVPDLSTNFKGAFNYKIPLVLSALTKHPGVLFLDELTNVQRDDMITAIYKIVAEKKVGNNAFHKHALIIAAGNRDEDAGIIKAHILTAPLVNRFQIIKVLPPKAEDWFLYMSNKYPEVPRYLLGFMSGIIKELNTKNDYLYRDIEDLPMDQRMFTTPRSLEAFCKAYYLLKSSGINFNYKILISSLAGFLSPEDYAQISVFLEQMENLQTVLESNQPVNRSTQIGALTYIGEMIKDLALSEKINLTLSNQLLPYEKIPHYIETFGKNRELLNFVMLGSGICDKNMPITKSIYIMGFLIGVLQGKSDVEAKAFADKEFKYKITDIFNVSGSKLQEIIDKMDKMAKGNALLEKFIDVFKYYNTTKISEALDLFKTYYIKSYEDLERNNLKNQLKSYLSESELKDLIQYVSKKVEKEIEEKTRMKR